MTEAWLDGAPLALTAGSKSGYTSFTATLPNEKKKALKVKHVLALRVDASYGSGHWYVIGRGESFYFFYFFWVPRFFFWVGDDNTVGVRAPFSGPALCFVSNTCLTCVITPMMLPSHTKGTKVVVFTATASLKLQAWSTLLSTACLLPPTRMQPTTAVLHTPS